MGSASPAARGASGTATSGLHIAPSEQTPDSVPTTDATNSNDEQVTRLDIPGRQDVLLQRDAEALAKLAADIFRNEPIDLWPARAVEALQQLQSALGRPLARDLAEKFLEYVQAVQQNARLRREFEEALRKLSRLASQQFGDDSEVSEAIRDLTQMGLDLAGTVDPTPTADGFNALISLSRGDLTGAGISAISMIAYFGDLAKLGKLAEYPKKLARAIKLALKSEKFAKLLTPVLKRLRQVLERIPAQMLPDRLRKPLENLKEQLDNFFRKADGPPNKAAGGHSTRTATGKGRGPDDKAPDGFSYDKDNPKYQTFKDGDKIVDYSVDGDKLSIDWADGGGLASALKEILRAEGDGIRRIGGYTTDKLGELSDKALQRYGDRVAAELGDGWKAAIEVIRGQRHLIFRR